MRKTKIICTIGPATSSKEAIKSLIDAGMDVCRLNFSHGSHKEHGQIISYIKDLRKGIKKPLAILLDTKGPEVRTKNIKAIPLLLGQKVLLHGDPNKDGIAIAPVSVLEDLKLGDLVLFDDGSIKSKIVEKRADGFLLEFISAGTLKLNKSVNIPGVKLNIPYFTEKDKEDIAFGIEQGVDAIAVSFTTCAEHILRIKELLRKGDAEHILVFSKIESLEGIHNFDEILEVSDGIMVARGDLAVECSFAHVPPMQRMMIHKCNMKGKPVIVATQMLESMVLSVTPTRAEVSDVANSVFDGTSCTMLSAETAVGEHPPLTVSVMAEIIIQAEKEPIKTPFSTDNLISISSKIGYSAVQIGNDINAGAILAFSKSGQTARRISAFRPTSKVIVISPEESTFHQTAFLFGAIAIKEKKDSDHGCLNEIIGHMLKEGWVKYGDLIVITMGVPYGRSYTTNTVRIESVGNAIVRGKPMDGKGMEKVEGEVAFYFPRGDKKGGDLSGKILIMREFFKQEGDLLKGASGIVLQNSYLDISSESALKEFSKKYNIPYIKQAEGAMALLKEGEKIRLEPSLGLIFH
jgi:pyruvate kinase